ncbi:DUF952 domain-containing protein [bacterium]|nr:DUF952 domain-containing protein [bacterium]
MPPAHLYKILTPAAWQQCQGQERLSLGKDDLSFIHLSESDQVARIASKFFKGETRVIVVELNPGLLPGRLVHEANPGGSTLYYHLYDGYLPTRAVTGHKVYSLEASTRLRPDSLAR